MYLIKPYKFLMEHVKKEDTICKYQQKVVV